MGYLMMLFSIPAAVGAFSACLLRGRKALLIGPLIPGLGLMGLLLGHQYFGMWARRTLIVEIVPQLHFSTVAALTGLAEARAVHMMKRKT